MYENGTPGMTFDVKKTGLKYSSRKIRDITDNVLRFTRMKKGVMKYLGYFQG